VTVCVEDHERAPPVVGHDPDHLGEGSRADGCSWSSYSTPFSFSQSRPRCVTSRHPLRVPGPARLGGPLPTPAAGMGQTSGRRSEVRIPPGV
jgi:hypothetical protein